MDKKTLIGLVLIGTIFSVFTILNRPSVEEQAKRAQEIKKEQALLAEKEKIAEKQAEKSSKNPIDTLKVTASDSVSVKTKSTNAEQVAVSDSLIYLENKNYKIAFNTKGGQIAGVWLKNFESYQNYAKQDGKTTALALFEEGDAVNQLVFESEGKKIETEKLAFYVKAKTDNSIIFETEVAPGKTIQNQYILSDSTYDVHYTVNMDGFGGAINANQIALNWKTSFRKTERLLSEQRRYSTICMNYVEEGYDYLSEMKSDASDAEQAVEWVAYKQSYFSSILKPDRPFLKKGSHFEVVQYEEGNKLYDTHIKDFVSTLMLDVSNSNEITYSMDWFFGPNDFNLLKTYQSDYDQIINYGWGIFRWINVYAIDPIYTFLNENLAISAGIAILILTFLIKLLLMPIQWKMYVSSAKMRILKPEIEEINKKFPKKEDAMKKQMEMMTLYRESGASPLSGCVPMLIQMPILFAVFRYFPSTFSLRQESFLWAEDLSSYDSVYNFGFNIWMYGDHISLFTLLMATTTLIYTVINSGNTQMPQQPGMPNMKIIMYIMPITMIFFFNNYSSGLSYYYFLSTLFSILIMIAIKKFFVDEDKLKAKMATKKANAGTKDGKKKSKFQERLEAMQKMQQEQMKNRRK